MGRQGSVRQSLHVLLLLVIPPLLVCSVAEAAYRLTFQNGTSVEVQPVAWVLRSACLSGPLVLFSKSPLVTRFCAWTVMAAATVTRVT